MTDITTYTPLRTIVSYTLDETNKSVADEDKLWILGLRALADLNFDISGQTKTIRIPVLPNKTAPLPADCITWSKVGLLDEKGQINTLKINNALTTYRDDNVNRVDYLTADINNGGASQALVPYYANYYYGGGVYQLFGVGGGIITYGECKIDEANRIIILPTDFRYDSVMFEYVSSPQKDQDYQVMTILQEAVIAFIKWKLKLGSYQEWIAECVKARRRMPKKKFILQSFNQVIRESNGMKLRS